MKLTFYIIPFVLLLQFPVATCQHIKSLPALIEKNLPSVVLLNGHGKHHMPSMGTAFIINEQGHCVTNYHVIDEMEFMQVITHDGQLYEPDSIIVQNDALDLAVFAIRNPEGKKFTPVKIAGKEARIGESVFVIGHPGIDYAWTTHTGVISGEVRLKKPYVDLIQTSVPVSDGNSGSPLFNDKGEVIGIIARRGGEHAKSISMAIPVKHLHGLKNDTTGIPYAFTHEALLGEMFRVVIDISRKNRNEKDYDKALDQLLPFARKHAEKLPVRKQIDLYLEIGQVYSAAEDLVNSYKYFSILYELIRPYMIEAYQDTASWQRVFASDPKLHETIFNSMMYIGICQTGLGMYSSADSTLGLAIGMGYDGLKMLTGRTIVYTLFLPQVHFSRALCKIQMGRLEEGCAELREALKLGNKQAEELINEYCK